MSGTKSREAAARHRGPNEVSQKFDASAAVIEVLGIEFARITLGEVLGEAKAAIAGGRQSITVSFGNPHSVVLARHNRVLREALGNSTYVLPDGIGIMLAARLLGKQVSGRITGWDFFESLMWDLERQGGGRVYFFGSSNRVLQRISDRLALEYPHLTLCGQLSPPFGEWSEEENEAFVSNIRKCRPDVLWVGMTAPKQECWVERNRHQLQIPVVGAIGAVFDFYAGTSPRAPYLVRVLGLEWVHRLLRNPRRMWRRTFISGVTFMSLTVRQALGEVLAAKGR